MQWLLHGSLTPDVTDSLVKHEHKTHATSELDLPPDATAADVLAACQKKQWDILTSDVAMSRIPFTAHHRFTRCIVYLQEPGPKAVDRLFDRYKRLSPGRLYTVTASRVKIRQLPTEIR